jgi:hypothetical protein
VYNIEKMRHKVNKYIARFVPEATFPFTGAAVMLAVRRGADEKYLARYYGCTPLLANNPVVELDRPMTDWELLEAAVYDPKIR